jgi:predicted ester cyclase
MAREKRKRISSRAHRRQLVLRYAEAKSQADVESALAVCHENFSAWTVGLGLASRGKEESRLHFHAFFHAFPDYRVALEGMAESGDAVACWGVAHMTMQGALAGLAPTGRSVALPFFSLFTFRDGLIAVERFLFDLGMLCDGVGISATTLKTTIAARTRTIAAEAG